MAAVYSVRPISYISKPSRPQRAENRLRKTAERQGSRSDSAPQWTEPILMLQGPRMAHMIATQGSGTVIAGTLTTSKLPLVQEDGRTTTPEATGGPQRSPVLHGMVWLANSVGAAMRHNRCGSTKTDPKSLFIFVGAAGFEPATPWSQTRCATGLRHAPNGAKIRTFRVKCQARPRRSRPSIPPNVSE